MPNTGRIPRWIVENDPSWERTIDSNPSVLKWNKKGTNIQAISHPTSTLCDIIGAEEVEDKADLPDLLSKLMMHNRHHILTGGDITKYLSSRYLNSNIGSLSGSQGIKLNTMPYRRSLFF
ncbi:MAG TPA: hypothetical protein VE619_05855 [Nitrososphaeraceae archaeon]|nr:hypothetical protein [Nitrososphaeraceae archaeon]